MSDSKHKSAKEIESILLHIIWPIITVGIFIAIGILIEQLGRIFYPSNNLHFLGSEKISECCDNQRLEKVVADFCAPTINRLGSFFP